MARVYKSVRLAYEAKVWINNLIAWRNEELQKKLKSGVTYQLEEKLSYDNYGLLNGVAVNVILKVTNGSVIEQAVRETSNYTDIMWRDTQTQMENAIKQMDDTNVDDVIPRLYLNVDVLSELEQLQIRLRIDGHGMPRLSYVIKLVVFAFHSMQGL